MENTALYEKINSLPFQVREEVMDFMDFLLQKSQKHSVENNTVERSKNLPGRRLGLLESKASFIIKDDFKITDETLLIG